MKKIRSEKINYNLFVEKKDDFFQGILTVIFKKEKTESKDTYVFLFNKNNISEDSVYLNIIENFIFEDFKKIKNKNKNIVSLNITTATSKALDFFKSKYKKVDPYKATLLNDIEEPFLRIKELVEEQKENGLQISIMNKDNDYEIKDISSKINNEKYLNTHFFSLSNYKKKKDLSERIEDGKRICFTNDNTDLDLYFYIDSKKEKDGVYSFCSTVIKKNKYNQNKNRYYTLNIDANSKIEALIKGITTFYTEDKKMLQILKSSHNINLYTEEQDNYGEKIYSIFKNVLSKDSTLQFKNEISNDIKLNMLNYIKKTNNIAHRKQENILMQVDTSTAYPKNTIIIYTDGTVKDKSELSCFGAVFRMPNSDNILYEITGNTNEEISKNQIDYIENKGIEESLRFILNKIESKKIENNFDIEVRSDSFNNIREINNMLNNNSTISNLIWKQKISNIVELSKKFKGNISFKWVKGHHLDPYNIRADKNASLGYIADENSIYILHEDITLEKKIKPQILSIMKGYKI